MPPATNSAGALAQLQQAQSSALTSDQATTAANQQFGVDQAQQTVTGLRGAIQRTTSLLNNVAPSVYGRTGNSLVTNAQATRQIGNESAPIQQDLSKNTADEATAEQDYQTAEQKAEAKAAGTLNDQSSRLSYLQGIYGNLYQQEQDAAKAAEAKRQFDLSLADSKAARASSGSGGASPSFGGGSSSGSVGSIAKDAKGGYAITNASGQPITLGQYAAANGLGINQISQLLMQSGNSNDQKIAAAINSNKYTSTQLRQMYPQALGGSY